MHPDHAGISPSLGSVAKARYRLPLEIWKKLFGWLSLQAQNLSQSFDKWKGHRVVLLDGSCISMPDNPELFEEFGRATGYHGKCRYPLARLVTLCIAGTMIVLDYALGRYNEDENSPQGHYWKSFKKAIYCSQTGILRLPTSIGIIRI